LPKVVVFNGDFARTDGRGVEDLNEVGFGVVHVPVEVFEVVVVLFLLPDLVFVAYHVVQFLAVAVELVLLVQLEHVVDVGLLFALVEVVPHLDLVPVESFVLGLQVSGQVAEVLLHRVRKWIQLLLQPAETVEETVAFCLLEMVVTPEFRPLHVSFIQIVGVLLQIYFFEIGIVVVAKFHVFVL